MFYKHHIFFCANQRTDGHGCCQDFDALAMRKYMKTRVKELGPKVQGNVRVNTAGCLNRCDLGPVIVIYPEAIWYTYIDKQDIDEIIESHLVKGVPVKRLMLENSE